MKYTDRNQFHTYDLHFTIRPPYGNISNSIWTGLFNGTVVMTPDWNEYSTIIHVEDITARLSQWIHASSTLADRLWSIGFSNQNCRNSQATVPWKHFISDIRASQNVRPIRGMKNCIFLRGALHHNSSNKRIESNIHNILDSVNIYPIHFSIHESFRSHIEKASLCQTATGLHGAQMVNMMWMHTGGKIIEFDTQKHYFYENMAHLTGHEYTRMSICPTCIAQPTQRGVSFHVAKFKSMYPRLIEKR